MRCRLALAVLSILLLAPPAPALADGWGAVHWRHGSGHRHHHHHGRHHHHRHGDRFALSLGFGVPLGYYPRHYHAPPPVVIYRQPQVVYQAPPPRIALGAHVGQGCREYTTPITVGGRVVQGYGIACPRPDGTWQIVE
jgi:hypothetical protein